jgi:hypothetical protein
MAKRDAWAVGYQKEQAKYMETLRKEREAAEAKRRAEQSKKR